MTITEAKTALVHAYRTGGDVLRASLNFTCAKKKARRYTKCQRCGATIKRQHTAKRSRPTKHCMMCHHFQKFHGRSLNEV
jgi:hypothetical protein